MKENKNLFFGQMTEIKGHFATGKEKENRCFTGRKFRWLWQSTTVCISGVWRFLRDGRWRGNLWSIILATLLLLSFPPLNLLLGLGLTATLGLFNNVIAISRRDEESYLFLSLLCICWQLTMKITKGWLSLSRFENAMNCSCFHLSNAKLKAWAIVSVAAWA